MSKVLFAGAGFSAPFGLPVMRNFFDKALDSKLLSDSDKQLLDEVRRSARQANAVLQGDNADLEHILSFATIFPNDNEILPRLQRILSIVMTSYKSIGKDSLLFQEPSTTGLLHLREVEGIVTTNYDITCECLFLRSRNGLRVSLPGNPILHSASSNSQSLYGNGPPICKLHGSVNWLTNDDGITEIDDSCNNYTWHLEEGIYRDLRPSCITQDRIDRAPLVIPPTLFKNNSHPLIRSAWSKAFELLSTATELVIVGYSFPTSDTYMRYFIGAALSGNMRLRSIRIIDPYASSIIEKLKSDSSNRFGSHFFEILTGEDKNWLGASMWNKGA